MTKQAIDWQRSLARFPRWGGGEVPTPLPTRHRILKFLATVLWTTSILLLPGLAHAGDDPVGTRPLSVLLMLAALSLVPLVLVMITSYAKVAVVLHILRAALNASQVPPTSVVTGLAVILTIYIMTPTGLQVYEQVQPVMKMGQGKGLLSAEAAEALLQAALKAREPVRTFLARHSRAKDVKLFLDLARRGRPKDQRAQVKDRDLLVLIPAFVIGQLKSAFEIGFLLFIPFLIIDLVVSNILLSLGMHMLSPTTVSLPFKLLLFVMADGWYLLARGLVMSY